MSATIINFKSACTNNTKSEICVAQLTSLETSTVQIVLINFSGSATSS